MLASLSIRDIVLIEKLDLTLSDGLTVLTGETGAGKSILLDSVSLALGWPWRTRATINDAPVSAQTLRLVGASLVELHGQHADRALVDSASHRALLDAYGGLGAEVGAVGARWRQWREAREIARDERGRLETAAREADFIRHAVEELSALGAEPGEEGALSERRSAMMRSEKIAADLSEALDAVAGGGSPIPSLSAAVRRLERRAGESQDLIRPAVEAIDQALDALEQARGHLETALADADFEPRELERIEERLFALRAAARKYAVAADALPELATRFAAQLQQLDQSEARLARLDAAAAQAQADYRAAAERLSQARLAAALGLDAAVGAELPPLKLERAEFLTKVTSDPEAAGAEGYDAVEFWVRTNPGSRPGPMMKVASGGELARFLLALKVVLADRGSAPTLIFDEIDTGVGGAVADAIGARLARLSQKVQVLCVTHAPQVAARAHHHLLIAKEAALADGAAPAAEAAVTTRVAALTPSLRREEIARMLAGATVTSEARAAAERLLKSTR